MASEGTGTTPEPSKAGDQAHTECINLCNLLIALTGCIPSGTAAICDEVTQSAAYYKAVAWPRAQRGDGELPGPRTRRAPNCKLRS